jgi:hypothetical protein
MCYVSSGIKQDLEKLLLGKSKLQTNNTAVKVINATLRLNEYKIRCALTNIQNSLASIYHKVANIISPNRKGNKFIW